MCSLTPAESGILSGKTGALRQALITVSGGMVMWKTCGRMIRVIVSLRLMPSASEDSNCPFGIAPRPARMISAT